MPCSTSGRGRSSNVLERALVADQLGAALDGEEEGAHAESARLTLEAEADARIAELQSSRAALERLRATCASGSKGPCPILEAFDGVDSPGARSEVARPVHSR